MRTELATRSVPEQTTGNCTTSYYYIRYLVHLHTQFSLSLPNSVDSAQMPCHPHCMVKIGYIVHVLQSLTLGAHAHERYSTHFVCVCVRLFLAPSNVYTTL